ncbi:hypothetical protein EG329_003791 [Mollisiaceae sp. DMI_Dod_QoI]|nr:hypothetical protein EG329_003791 [Helotiales sp. DMI_Dod_QoI]
MSWDCCEVDRHRSNVLTVHRLIMNSVAVNLLAHAVTADINVAQCVPEERHSYRLVLRRFIFVAGSNIFETAGNVDEMA